MSREAKISVSVDERAVAQKIEAAEKRVESARAEADRHGMSRSPLPAAGSRGAETVALVIAGAVSAAAVAALTNFLETSPLAGFARQAEAARKALAL